MQWTFFVEICNVSAKKAVIKAAKRIINSDKMCRSYSDLNFGVTFLEHSVDSLSVEGSPRADTIHGQPFCSCDLDLDPMT